MVYQLKVLQDHLRNNKILAEMSDPHLLEISLLVNCLNQRQNQSFHLNKPRANLYQIWQLLDLELPLSLLLPQSGLPLLQSELLNNLLPNSINSNSNNKQTDNSQLYSNNPERLQHQLLSNNLDVLAHNKDPDKLSPVNKHLPVEILKQEFLDPDNHLSLNNLEDKVDFPVNNLISSKMVLTD
jgi:hypothetical protein